MFSNHGLIGNHRLVNSANSTLTWLNTNISIGDGAIDDRPDDGNEQQSAKPYGKGDPIDGLDEHEEDHVEGQYTVR